jgi:hypothetical protein
MIKQQILHPFFGDRITYVSATEHLQIFGPPNIRMLAKLCGLEMTRCEPSDVETYGDRGRFFDFGKRLIYWPLVQSAFRTAGWNLGHSLNCILTKIG